MENTSENKAKYFAAHWGQKVLILDECNPPYHVWSRFLDCVQEPRYGIIELINLSQITDEDAIEVGRMHGHEDEENLWTDEYLLYVGKRVMSYFPNYTTPVPVKDLLRIADFLRSKGYLLPYHDLSTEELLSRGWAKEKQV